MIRPNIFAGIGAVKAVLYGMKALLDQRGFYEMSQGFSLLANLQNHIKLDLDAIALFVSYQEHRKAV
jgi:hypothetical protein